MNYASYPTPKHYPFENFFRELKNPSVVESTDEHCPNNFPSRLDPDIVIVKTENGSGIPRYEFGKFLRSNLGLVS